MMTEEELNRIIKLGGRSGLNFIAEMCADIREQEAALEAHPDREKLPLYGEKLFIKDNIDVKGTHTTAGSLALSDNLAEEDAPVVRRLRENGAVILGKSNMTEFANYTTSGMPGGYSSRGGQVIHATDPSYSPSGSSSGSAVAVASGAVNAAIGTDTSFSVIACAQENGISGLKPARGALSSEGIIPIARTLDSAGVLARSFREAVKVYSGMREEPVGYGIAPLSGMRDAVNIANRDMISEEHRAGIERFITKLRGHGVQVTEIDQEPTPIQRVIMQCEFREHLEDYLRGSNASMKTLEEIVKYYEADPDTMMKYGDTLLRGALYDAPLGTRERAYIEAMSAREALIDKTRAEINDMDAVLMTGPTNVMHTCGLPSATIRLRENNSRGFSRCLIMYGADEKRLFEAALAFEAMESGSARSADPAVCL